MNQDTLRIHPAIGIARVGNSDDYVIGPETMAGFPDPQGGNTTGGLPIVPGSESKTVTSSQLRDNSGALKRQAARFRIFVYPNTESESYPRSDGTEVQVGSTIDGKVVKDIVWFVHVANKKANCYEMDEKRGVDAYKEHTNKHGNKTDHPRLRNAKDEENPNSRFSDKPNDPERLRCLMIDPGPRTIKGTDSGKVKFNQNTKPSYWKDGVGIRELDNYPTSFPANHFDALNCPSGKGITTLGELETEQKGRLVVLGGFGTACGWTDTTGKNYGLNNDVNNDGWFDDISDGPVRAALVFEDESVREVEGSAWVISTDPAYAPQILNVVSLWDDIFDAWVRNLNLCPHIYDNGFKSDYQPSFDDEIYPIFLSASLQKWTTNLPGEATSAHDIVGRITAQDRPSERLHVPSLIRDPNEKEASSEGPPRMPLALGDAGKSFLSLRPTQYFFLKQWFDEHFHAGSGAKLGPGEQLDKSVLVNCLGGRFNPGIDMTFIVRQPEIYRDWPGAGVGPFRIRAKKLDYETAQHDRPFLSEGYIPLRDKEATLEPGDTQKFMAIPWHTDYNSCAIHQPQNAPSSAVTLYWSWPAQRPVAVYRAAEVNDREVGAQRLGPQRFSVRTQGTKADNEQKVGRFQDEYREKMVQEWHNIGVVIQGSAIDDKSYPANFYLEVSGFKEDHSNRVTPWPNKTTEPTHPPPSSS